MLAAAEVAGETVVEFQRRVILTYYDTEPAVAAIEFMLSQECECPMDFIRCWDEGDFDAIREEWPEAPKEVYRLDWLPARGYVEYLSGTF